NPCVNAGVPIFRAVGHLDADLACHDRLLGLRGSSSTAHHYNNTALGICQESWRHGTAGRATSLTHDARRSAQSMTWTRSIVATGFSSRSGVECAQTSHQTSPVDSTVRRPKEIV